MFINVSGISLTAIAYCYSLSGKYNRDEDGKGKLWTEISRNLAFFSGSA